MTYHLRGISKFFSEAPIKTALLIPFLVRGFENTSREAYFFRFPVIYHLREKISRQHP